MRSSTTNPWTRASSASGGYVRSTNFIGCRRLSRTISAPPALWRASADTIARMTEVAASSAIIVLRYPFLLGKSGDPNFASWNQIGAWLRQVNWLRARQGMTSDPNSAMLMSNVYPKRRKRQNRAATGHARSIDLAYALVWSAA